jgi:rhodanese-related sulfurtransferase
MTSRPIITLADLSKISAQELAALLSNPTTAAKVAVVDVRDSDHIGGHIKGSSWVPTSELEARIPELIRLNRDKDQVVFHCMLSQQRGPSSALKFMRALQMSDAHVWTGGNGGENDSGSGSGSSSSSSKGSSADTKTDSADVKDAQVRQAHLGAAVTQQQHGPKIYVLEGGFGVWAPRYGDDPQLTEAFVKDLWE